MIFDLCTSLLLRTLALLVFQSAISLAHAQEDGDPKNLPIVSREYVLSAYQGSFKVEFSDDFSTTRYSSGRVAFNPDNYSIFVDSHIYELGIGEFKIPDVLSTSSDESQLPNAQVLQGFTALMDRTDTGVKDNINRIGGMDMIDGNLVIQGYEFYDALGDAKQTTAVVRDPENLAESEVDGFYQMQGGARTVNYLSPIPQEWRTILGGRYLAGNGGGMSIVTRNSEGPSIYVFDPTALADTNWEVPTKVWMNYPAAEHALSTKVVQGNYPDWAGWDVVNDTGANDLWTEESVAAFGFIIPGTRTFMAVGSSGMHESGGGYKITNDAGYACPGFCAKSHQDYHSYYWLFDLNEVINASNPWSVLPYEYGVFDDRWVKYSGQEGQGFVTGGSFDLNTGLLILSHRAATSNKTNANPVLSVYKLPVVSPPTPPEILRLD